MYESSAPAKLLRSPVTSPPRESNAVISPRANPVTDSDQVKVIVIEASLELSPDEIELAPSAEILTVGACESGLILT